MTFEFGLLHIFAHITYTKICILHWENFKCEMVLQWMGLWQPFQVEGENVGKPLTQLKNFFECFDDAKGDCHTDTILIFGECHDTFRGHFFFLFFSYSAYFTSSSLLFLRLRPTLAVIDTCIGSLRELPGRVQIVVLLSSPSKSFEVS